MKLKLIKVDYKFFGKNKQTVLAENKTKLRVIPNVGDVLHYAGERSERYKVVQRDIYISNDLSDENVTLFLSKLDW